MTNSSGQRGPTMSENQRKRRHCDADDNDEGYVPLSPPRPVKPRIRDSDLWFNDGNVVLVAGDVEFRVYTGPLTKRSPEFREILSGRLPHIPDERLLTIPVVELPDHPSDVRRLLGSLMFGSDLRCVSPSTICAIFGSLTGCMRNPVTEHTSTHLDMPNVVVRHSASSTFIRTSRPFRL